jgi:hypothetical protein
MWQGQQPPGGEQNPQNQNPYQQPGYQQPNPYQQPAPGQAPGPGGYAQPNPYQQPPAVPQWNPQQQPGPPQQGGGGGKGDKKTRMVAIVAATAVVVTAVVTGVVVMNKKNSDDSTDTTASGDSKKSSTSASVSPSTSASDTASDAPSDEASAGANPRGTTDLKPLIAGWKVVSNPKYGTAFDVPPEWDVSSPGYTIGFEDEKKGDGSPLVAMSAPASYKDEWCKDDSDKDGHEETTSLGLTGTKGANGATDTKNAAMLAANNWAYAAFAQNQTQGMLKNGTPVAFTSSSGLAGYEGKSTISGITKKRKCDSNGAAWSFAFKNLNDDFSVWILTSATGVTGEISDATAKKIMSTVRLYAKPAAAN